MNNARQKEKKPLFFLFLISTNVMPLNVTRFMKNSETLFVFQGRYESGLCAGRQQEASPLPEAHQEAQAGREAGRNRESDQFLSSRICMKK